MSGMTLPSSKNKITPYKSLMFFACALGVVSTFAVTPVPVFAKTVKVVTAGKPDDQTDPEPYASAHSWGSTSQAAVITPTQLLTNNASGQSSVRRVVSLMSTQVTFEILTNAADDPSAGIKAEQSIDESIAEFRRIEQTMSEWRPDSDLSELNRLAGRESVDISAELFRLLSASYQVSELSQGAFDITFKSAGKLWDFRKAKVPTQDQIERSIENIDYRRLVLSEAESGSGYRAYLTHPGTQVGMGAIAKGYAIDRAVQILRSGGFSAFSINAGGDLYVSGKTEKRLWNVGIQHPRDSQSLLASLTVSNLAIATSGDYERYFIKDGERFSHIIDPATGFPANLCQSVTIMATRAFWADALATAVFVMGPEQGLQLIESLEGIETLIVDQSGGVIMSSGFNKALSVSQP